MTARQPLALALIGLALLAQAVMPWVHAGAMSQHAGQGWAAAFCGNGSSALLAEFRAVAPAELKQALNPQPKPAPTAADCPLCLLASALGTLAAAAVMAFFLARLSEAQTRTCPAPQPRHALSRAHACRGPPLLS